MAARIILKRTIITAWGSHYLGIISNFFWNMPATWARSPGTAKGKSCLSPASALAHRIVFAILARANNPFILIFKDRHARITDNFTKWLLQLISVSYSLGTAGVNSAIIAMAKILYMQSRHRHCAFCAVCWRRQNHIS